MVSAKDLLGMIPAFLVPEVWFVEWKSRLEKKTKEQEELDKKLWEVSAEYKWDEAEELIRKGATSDHVDSLHGGLTAYWFLKFENKTSLSILTFPKISN